MYDSRGYLISRGDEIHSLFESHRPMNRVKSRTNLLFLKQVFDSHEIDFCLAYGTLLGAVREKNFIVGDTDIDLVLSFEDKFKVENCLKEFMENGFCLIRKTEQVWSLEKELDYIDLYFFKPRTVLDFVLNRSLCKLGCWCMQINNNYLTGFDEIVLFGQRFKTFKNHLKWVEHTYGADWKIPQNKKGNTRTLLAKLLLSKYGVKARCYFREWFF